MVYHLYFLLIKELTGICTACIPFPSHKGITLADLACGLTYIVLTRHYAPLPPSPFCWLDLATSVHDVGEWGLGAYNWIIVFMHPPFLAVECARETVMAELSVTVSSRAACDGAHGGSVLQGKGSCNYQWRHRVCAVRKCSFRTTTMQLTTRLPLRSQSLGRCTTGQYVGS